MGGTGNSTLWGSAIPGGLPSAAYSGQTLVSDLLYAALRQAGILRGARRGASGSENADAFDCLNRMLESWNTDRLAIYTIRAASYPLTSGKQAYTIGQDPTGQTAPDFDAARPARIEQANLIITTEPPLRRPIKLLNDQQWASIRIQAISTAIPQKLYNDGGYPFSTLYLWPAPSLAYQLELYTWQALGTFTGPTDTVILPPGYTRAIVSNLALELCITFGIDPRPLLVKVASESKAAIESLNAPMPVMGCDSGVLGGRRSGTFNWLTGE
jgi:hypothetical protein